MENVNIVMTRIDERLLHGQGQLWLKYLGANTVLVVNDEVSIDTMQQSLMKMIISKDIAVRFFTVQKTIDIISKASPKQKIFILIKNCEDALKLVKGGVPINKINIGNIHNAQGKEKITRSIFLGEEDKIALREMINGYNVEFDTKTTPSGDDGALPVDIKKCL